MKKILTLLLCGVLVLSLAACGGKEEDNAPTPTEPTEESYKKVYVDEPTVNQFICDMYERSDMQLLGITRGTEEGQYVLYANNCEVTVSSTDYGLYLDIRGGKTERDLENAISLFRRFTLIADRYTPEDNIEEAAALMRVKDGSFSDYRVGNYVKILRYRALTDVPTVSIDCHIEMLLLNYLPIVEEE